VPCGAREEDGLSQELHTGPEEGERSSGPRPSSRSDRASRDGGRAVPGAINDLKKLCGTPDAYRIRVGDYRVGVTIGGELVEFVRFPPRRDLYRFFP